jgi:predicted DNA binding CopG/RHH family protein
MGAKGTSLMPTKGTKMRHVRVNDALWTAAKQTADKRGENLSAVIRECLKTYVEKGTK